MLIVVIFEIVPFSFLELLTFVFEILSCDVVGASDGMLVIESSKESVPGSTLSSACNF